MSSVHVQKHQVLTFLSRALTLSEMHRTLFDTAHSENMLFPVNCSELDGSK